MSDQPATIQVPFTLVIRRRASVNHAWCQSATEHVAEVRCESPGVTATEIGAAVAAALKWWLPRMGSAPGGKPPPFRVRVNQTRADSPAAPCPAHHQLEALPSSPEG